VLATTDPQKVPATVLSRCLQFNLRPMAPQTIVEHLGAVLAQEGLAADASALKLIARAARGSMRDALSITDQAIAYGSGAVEEEPVRRMLGAVDRGHAARLVEALAAHDGKALIGAVDGLRELAFPPTARSRSWPDCCRRWRCCRRCPAPTTTAIPTPPSPPAWRRFCRPTRRSFSTASSCTAGPSCRFRPTNTAAW
jgi:DNA polymerase-3 subunit gamma/tau